jgi:ATP synthase F1 delta subunit
MIFYIELLQAGRGAVHVTIISAEALKEKQLKSIQQAVTKLAGSGKTVDIKTQVDPNILSGLQVLVGDRFLDLSVSSRIADISKALDATV